MQKRIFLDKRYWALFGVGISSFLGCMDFTIVNTALPSIQNSFNTSINQLQWVINIFVLALSANMVIMGRIADIYGRKRILYLGLFIFAISSFFAGVSPSINWLIFWRLIQGISAAIFYTTSGAIASNIFDIEERGSAMGIFFGISFTGLAAGPVLGGLIVGSVGWRWIFLINVPLVVICLLICWLTIAESNSLNSNKKIDYRGAVILMLGVTGLVFALTQANSWGWLSYKIILIFLFSGIMLALLYYEEKHITSPIINFSFFVNRKFISSIVATVGLAFFYCVAFFLMPLYLHLIKGESSYTIGLMLLPTTLCVALTSPYAGKIVDRKGPEKVLILGLFLFIFSAILQANFSSNSSIIILLIAFIFMGVAWGLIAGPSVVLAMSALPSSCEAFASGTLWTLHNIGGAIGLALGVAVYREQVTKHNNLFIFGYRSAMYLLVVSSTIALIILLWNLRKEQIN